MKKAKCVRPMDSSSNDAPALLMTHFVPIVLDADPSWARPLTRMHQLCRLEIERGQHMSFASQLHFSVVTNVCRLQSASDTIHQRQHVVGFIGENVMLEARQRVAIFSNTVLDDMYSIDLMKDKQIN